MDEREIKIAELKKIQNAIKLLEKEPYKPQYTYIFKKQLPTFRAIYNPYKTRQNYIHWAD